MPYILVARDADGPSARLVSSDLFRTREAALDALQDLVAATPGLREARLFVVDLDLASPVLLVGSTEAPPVADLPVPPPLDEEVAPGPLSIEPGLDTSAELPALTDEEHGTGAVVARTDEEYVSEPVQVVPENQDAWSTVEGEPADLGSIREDEGLVGSPGTIDTAAAPSDVGAPEVDGPADSSVWFEATAVRDAEVLQAISSLGRDERSEPAPEVPAAPEAPTLEADQVTGPDAWPWAEEASEPSGVTAEALSSQTTEQPPGAPESAAPAAESVPEAHGELDRPEAEESHETAPPPYASEAGAAEDAAPAEAAADYLPPGYEFAGDLDLAGYACEDCIYVNTCPRAGESAPAECGSFQWRSS